MVSPSINIYRDLILPIGESLRQDPRFSDVKNIIYDSDREMPFSELPAIEYYIESPWTDEARGSSSYSPQTRMMTTRVVFFVMIYDAVSRQRLDETLFNLSGLLLDWLRDSATELNPMYGIGLSKTPIVWQVIRPQSEEGFLGIQSLSAEFVIYTA